VEHLGEAVFRNDLDNSVVELGDLLVHEGPALAAERAAAEIFGAERTYFVLNGTSTSNKIALSSLVAPGDLVLFDRNNHKAAHHGALVLGGGVPVYLETDRNAHGLIGPIDYEALDEARIREKIRRHPLIKDPEKWQQPRPFRVAVIEQCTYDGTIYSAELLLKKLGRLCDYIVFDEAWAGFMKFHPLFRGRFAMGLQALSSDDPGIICTQSTHKQLAGFSQASQIHVKDSHISGQARRVEQRRFNEMFLLYASTSPFYPLFASLDVGAQMMKGRSGEVLWDDTIRLGIELRKKVRALKHEFETDVDPDRCWFFDPFVPDTVPAPERAAGRIAWESVPTDLLASEPRYWELSPGAGWHGFTQLAAGYAMTDPNKLTLLTPGFNRPSGSYAEHGIPASVLAEYLRENRIVPEKNDLNSILFLLTPGLESSKAGTLLSALVSFKRLHDDNAPLDQVIPAFVSRFGDRYRDTGLRDLCHDMHVFYRSCHTQALQRAQFMLKHFPEIALTPQEATHRLVRNEVEYLPIDEVAGRVAATLALVYPPGIGVIVPGERYDERAKPMLEYFKMFERAGNAFPGFENEIQGVYREPQSDGTVRLYTYVIRE
jgi:ornithine decarboxylase